MRARRALIGSLLSVGLLVPGLGTAGPAFAAPTTPSAASLPSYFELDYFANFAHGKYFPTATGFTEYDRSSYGREAEVTIRNVKSLAGKRLSVYVNRVFIGTVLVNRYGVAHREWDTAHGQKVPYAAAGSLVRAWSPSGKLVVSATLHRDY